MNGPWSMRGTVSPGIVRIGRMSGHFHNVYTHEASGVGEQLDHGQLTGRYVITGIILQRKPEWDAFRCEVGDLQGVGVLWGSWI
jgi:hypothetical protein